MKMIAADCVSHGWRVSDSILGLLRNRGEFSSDFRITELESNNCLVSKHMRSVAKVFPVGNAILFHEAMCGQSGSLVLRDRSFQFISELFPWHPLEWRLRNIDVVSQSEIRLLVEEPFNSGSRRLEIVSIPELKLCEVVAGLDVSAIVSSSQQCVLGIWETEEANWVATDEALFRLLKDQDVSYLPFVVLEYASHLIARLSEGPRPARTLGQFGRMGGCAFGAV